MLNSTYDIKWGKPDMTALACSTNGTDWPALPTCVNTSFPGYAGSWTMATANHPHNGSATPGTQGNTSSDHAGDAGLISGTSWEPAAWNSFVFPHSAWSLEVRFPIRQTPGYSTRSPGPGDHGGLLDADPVRQSEWNKFDPALGDPGVGRPRFVPPPTNCWWCTLLRP